MASLISCPTCGKQTPISRLMCMHCGSKLHGAGGKRSGGKPGGGGVVRAAQKFLNGLIRLVVLVALAGVIGLGLWSLSAPAMTFEDRDLLSADTKLEKLHASVRAGRADSGVFHEKEINAYFRDLLDQSGQSGASGLTVSIQGLNLDIRDGDMRILMHTGLGPVSLSWELVFVAEVQDEEGFIPAIRSARIGHLPLPGLLEGIVSAKFAAVFSEMAVEHQILGRLKAVEVTEDQVKVFTRGKTP